jgi:heme/copper-type cytochrome/quinol oxidase subunit 3
MRLFLASLAVFFVGAAVLVCALRVTSSRWPPVGSVQLPVGVWVSTALLLLCSASVEWAARSVRRESLRALRIGLLLTLAGGIGFLLSQCQNWLALHSAGQTVRANTFVGLFYVLSALHLIHVLGGLIPLSIVALRCLSAAPPRRWLRRVPLCGLYWHFLDAAWVLLLAVMMLLL